MIQCEVVYSVIRWTKSKFATTGDKAQPDETHKFDAKSEQDAKQQATEWGGIIEFRDVRWKRDDKSSNYRRKFTKSVYEDDLELKLTLQCRYK